MKRLRVGILGQGRSGYAIHVAWLRQDRERYEIAAVSDEMPERCKEASEGLGAKAFPDHRALLADKSLKLDLIINALPSFLHPQGTLEAFAAGYDVVCEKPLARSVADFDRMTAAARASGKTLLPFQNSRFQPAFRKVQEVVASGCLGRIIHARLSYSGFARRWDWQCRRDRWGGNLLNTGPHPMDHAIVLFGESMPNVFARLVSENPYGDAENFASVTLWGKGAPTIEVVISSFMAYPQGDTYNIGGTMGGLTGGATELRWRHYVPATAPAHSMSQGWSVNRTYCSEELDWVEENWKFTSKLGMFDLICKEFYTNAYEVLVNGAPRVITLDQVRRQIAVIEEAHRQNPDLT
ncbi:MAG: Gfo/Idh/MocA family oxidoreductase [Kiritimatiellae bacterium]|nr:Gfo/Idh/MocA family oxidoreductase [Kiritimatiellia bacterium]